MNTVNLYEYCVLDTAHLQVNQVVTMSSSIEKYCQVTMCFADGKRKVTAFDIRLKADDHSEPDLTCRLDSATANTTSAPPKRPFLSSLSWIKCMDERIWLRSTDSPRRILSHWVEGIPSGRLLATRKRVLTPDRSSLNWRRVLQVSMQLALRDELREGLNHGISSSLTRFRGTLGSWSSPSGSPLETWSKRSSTSSRIRLPEGRWLVRWVVPGGERFL